MHVLHPWHGPSSGSDTPHTVNAIIEISKGSQCKYEIIAVATHDPSVNHVKDIETLSDHFIATLKNFFEQYKVLEKKKVIIDEFQSREKAYEVINASLDLYNQKYGTTHK